MLRYLGEPVRDEGGLTSRLSCIPRFGNHLVVYLARQMADASHLEEKDDFIISRGGE